MSLNLTGNVLIVVGKLNNFLIIERVFFDDIKLNGKEINKYLKLEKLNTPDEVYQKFLELYDTSNKVRVNSETLDSIESVRLYLSKRPEVYSRLKKISALDFSFKIFNRNVD